MTVLWRVKYQIATYSGTIEVYADDDTDKERVIALAKMKLSRASGPLPFGYQSFTVERVP